MGVDPEALRAAAFRLKHDVGKAVRWHAPAVRETKPEALRSRLAADLLATRVGPDGRARSAVEIYEAWLADDGVLFGAMPALSVRLTRMSEAIEAMRRRLPHLSSLGWDDLVALDDASRVVQEEAGALWRDALAATADADELSP